jgi:2-iminobutanoate/2-iminopropanoate deaminase
MPRKAIRTDLAPAAIGPYEQAIRVGDFLYSSGQIALDPKMGTMVGGGIEKETVQTLENVKAILEADGFTLEHVVKTTVYLASMEDFGTVNKIYEQYFSKSKPARACIQAGKLPKGALVEIDVVAHIEL